MYSVRARLLFHLSRRNGADCERVEGDSSIFSQEAELWRRVGTLEPLKRDSALILNVDPVARGVCMAVRCGRIIDPDGATRTSQVFCDYFSPGAVDAIYRGVVRILQVGRASRTVDEYLARCDLLRKSGV